ncbi:MAG: hypothetical protein ACOYMV_13150 [Verrucomicrobiia bacterium]
MITAETYRSQFEGNGVAIEFAFGFPVRDKDHVLVTKTVAGVDTTLVVDVDYTVNGVDSADPADWSIAYPISGDPLASGELLTIVPNLPLKQLTDFGNQAAFFAKNHERAFDYLTLLSQQNREILDRCVRLPVGTDEDAADVLATLDSAIAAASLSAATSTAAAASSAASSALAEAAAEGVGVVRGLASTALPSGLTILHQPDPRFPIVRVLVTVGGGTADAAPGQRPLAHLAEHVAFRTPLAGGPAFQTLRAAGCDSESG